MLPQTNITQNPGGNVELLEIELTKRQIRALSKLLPNGFSLEQKSNRKKGISSGPSKKLFTNDGTQVVKKTKKSNDHLRGEMIINKQVLRDPGKRRLSSHFEYKYPDFETTSVASSKSSHTSGSALRKCYSLLQKLKKHRSSAPFLLPVDAEGLGLIDYHDIVSEPMDLSTVENKLRNNQYSSVNQFGADVRKIWNNAMMYNMQGSMIYLMTVEMSNYFEKLMNDVENAPFSDSVRDLQKKVEMLSKQITELNQRGLSHTSENLRSNPSGAKSSSRTSKLSDKPLSLQEKKSLGQNIKRLSPDHLRGVWDIVSSSLTAANGQEELEFDIEHLPIRVARELERYVKNKIGLANRGKGKSKAKQTQAVSSVHPDYANLKQHETEYEPILKGEDEVTTQHHSVVDSEGKADSKEDLNIKDHASPSNSSDSSFISESDSDREDGPEHKDSSKNSKSLEKQQELANFLAGDRGSMLNSFIVK